MAPSPERKRHSFAVRLITAIGALAPPLAFGAMIVLPYLQQYVERLFSPPPQSVREMLRDEIVRGVLGPPRSPGVLGTIVLAACVLIAEVPIAVELLVRSRRALKLSLATAVVGLLWLGCTFQVARAETEEALEPPSNPMRTPPSRPTPFDDRMLLVEPWALYIAPALLTILLPIGFGSAWLVHLVRSPPSGNPPLRA